jgi:thioredoxin 1
VAKIHDVTDADFDAVVVQSDLPVLVDFWAEWCGPCKVLAPVIKQIADEHPDTLRVVKLDVDACPATPARFSVRAMPTLLFFKGGQVVDSLVGAVPKRQVDEKVAGVLAG